MRNELGSNGLANKAGQVRSNHLHSSLEVSLDFSSEFEHSEGLGAKILQALDVELTDLLSHRVVGSLDDSFSELSVSNDLLNFLQGSSGSGSIADQGNKLDKDVIIRDNLGKLGEMPRIPLLDSHGEGVDILIQKFQQTDGLDDRLILSVDVQGNFVSGEGMGQTQS